ncbi:MAG TPA: DUF2314 domain-containing protein [Anaerolineales bacterium]|nr:DUF2314 domain-containing protein [Anaerolineales bacterium]
MVKALQLKILFIVGMLLAISCTSAASTQETLSTFTDDDPELEEAVRQAQNTLHIFRQEMLSPSSSYLLVSLKVRFVAANGEAEDMWTEPVYILDDVYTVRMVEGVTITKGTHPDRLVDVQLNDIVDWMLLQEDGKVIGGYTLKLDYERLTPEEQRKYRDATGYKFD